MNYTNLILVALALLVGKRMLKGPHVLWARTGGALAVVAWAALLLAGTAESPLATLGLLLLAAACLVWAVMFTSECWWVLRHGRHGHWPRQG